LELASGHTINEKKDLEVLKNSKRIFEQNKKIESIKFPLREYLDPQENSKTNYCFEILREILMLCTALIKLDYSYIMRNYYPRGFEALLEASLKSQHLQSLREFKNNNCCLEESLHGHITLLGQMSFLPNLKVLDLFDCHMGINMHVFSQLSFPSLEVLFLERNYIQSNIKKFSTMCFPKLQKLDLSDNSIRCEGMQCISKMSKLTELREVNLTHNKIGDKGILSFDNKTWPQLEVFEISWNNLGNKGLEYLRNLDREREGRFIRGLDRQNSPRI